MGGSEASPGKSPDGFVAALQRAAEAARARRGAREYDVAIAALATSQPRGYVPANLVAGSVEQLKVLMLDEGIPVAWVIPATLLRDLLAAPSSASRRDLIDLHRDTILAECGSLIRSLGGTASLPFVRFAMGAHDALVEGHGDAAQALAANTLDLFVTRTFSKSQHKTWIASTAIEHPERLSLAQFFVVCQLWGIYRSYRPRSGQPVPTTFNRHASVHNVSSVQYTETNAVLGVAHLVSVLTLLDIVEDYRSPKSTPSF